jgi:hypothetical protein
MLVLIGTRNAAASDNVKKEVLEFKKTGRPIIPITFVDQTEFSEILKNDVPENLRGTLERATWHKEIAGIAKTIESKERLTQTDKVAPGPSSHVITRIINAEEGSNLVLVQTGNTSLPPAGMERRGFGGMMLNV